jgi:hypothetical protein
VTGSPATGGIGAVLAVIIAAAINIAVNWAQRDGST